jgi:hypothetical protein
MANKYSELYQQAVSDHQDVRHLQPAVSQLNFEADQPMDVILGSHA